jgi:hypothetical protein
VDKIIVGSFLVLMTVVVIGLLCGLPIMWLWNWLCPQLFHLPTITFWQAIGLFALVRCLWPAKS